MCFLGDGDPRHDIPSPSAVPEPGVAEACGDPHNPPCNEVRNQIDRQRRSLRETKYRREDDTKYTTRSSTLVKRTLDPTKIHRDPKSQIGATMASEKHIYKIESVLQSAIYGGVFQAAEMDYNGVKRRVVAVKIMLKALERKQKGQLQEDIHAELKYHKDMAGHPNVLTLSDSWSDMDCIYIVMPYAEYQDLFEVLKKRPGPFSEREGRWLFEQVLGGAYFLHRRRLAFRDHSMENVLMFKNPRDGTVHPMITDPGQAVRIEFDPDGNRVQGLYAEKLFGKSFRPPEVYRKQQYNPVKVDTFCLGWMLFYVLTKHQPFDRAVDNDPHWPYIRDGRLAELIRLKHGRDLSPQATHLISMMLHPDMNVRHTPWQSLKHEWFRGTHVPVTEQTLYGLHLRPQKKERPKETAITTTAKPSGTQKGPFTQPSSFQKPREKRNVLGSPLYSTPVTQHSLQPTKSQELRSGAKSQEMARSQEMSRSQELPRPQEIHRSLAQSSLRPVEAPRPAPTRSTVGTRTPDHRFPVKRGMPSFVKM